jgi:hypothetical protein
LSTDASRFFDEANNDIGCLVDCRIDRVALLRTEARQHVVGRVHTARWPANTDPQTTKRACSQPRDDVAQTVVPTVAATIPLAHLSKWQVEVVVDDEQTFGRRAPAFDRFEDDQPAVVHKT